MVAVHPATRGQFKRVVVQDTHSVAAIKLCLQFRGPPDAVHGDMLYEKVRTQAKDTLDAIYSDDPSSDQHQQYGGVGGGGGGGFGSQSYGGSSGYGNSTSYSSGSYGASSSSAAIPGPKKMEGIGNPMFADPRLSQKKDIGEMTVGDVVSSVKEGFVGMIKDPLARSAPSVGAPRPGGMGGYGGPSSSSWNSAPPGRSSLAQSTNGAWTMASNRGPNAYNSSETYKSGSGNISSGVGGSWGSAPSSHSSQTAHHSHVPTHNANPIVHISGATGAAKSDGAYEKNLITELCPPGGMKAEPPPEKLQAFAQAIPNLNPDLICPALLDALEDGQPWIIRAKALCVMEICINVAQESVKSGASGNNAYADFFHACKDEIEPLATHTRIAVRDPAKRVLKALGLQIPTMATATATATSNVRASKAPVPAAAPAPAQNLLDFDEPSEPMPAHNPPPPLPVEAPPAPPVANSSGNSESLFGGMNLKSNVSSSSVMKQSVTENTTNDSSDLLGDLTESISPAPVPSSGGEGLFDNMAMKSTSLVDSSPQVEKENVENAATSMPATSGFSFISGESSEKTKPQSQPAAKESFDPLLGLDSTNAVPVNKMQQQQPSIMNPQMAAVMQQQQQQIMMMQAQMQQMQMAGNTRFMMMQQNQMQNSSGSAFGTGMVAPNRQNIMGANNGSGVATSFAFFEDPNKARREASNKKFEFVQDAMKGAR